jgi:asparagine synthase (glutamine-hydrolysing)
MCSIAGITNGTSNDVMKMLKAMVHRAPDDIGVFKDNNISLGMGRLSIVDLKSQNLCPFQNEEIILSFNGEIYNYKSLRQDLKKFGYKFKTSSDTEVLGNAWDKWGKNIFNKIKGMFVFAIYEKKTGKLFIARDIPGEKPLYYIRKNNNLYFASEAKALKKILDLKKIKNEFFDTFQHCSNQTLWKDVHQLPAAHYIEFNTKNKKFSLIEYWKLKHKKINKKTAQEELEYLLNKSVNLCTQADVDYGVYYSKGVDSTLISTFHKFKNKIYFDDKLNYEQDFRKKIKKIAYHLDFPVGSFSSYPLWKLAERAKKNKIKVTLSGEGADEIFTGYARYMPIFMQWKLNKSYPSYEYLFNKFYSSYHDGYARLTSRNEENFELVKKTMKKYFEMFDNPVTAMCYFDFKTIMPSLLQMGDRMSSAHGVENRCPFLDKDIIEFGFNLDVDQKINFNQQKLILRNILKKRSNSKYSEIEKKGLTIKFNKWFNVKSWDRTKYFQFLFKNWKSAYNVKSY